MLEMFYLDEYRIEDTEKVILEDMKDFADSRVIFSSRI